MKNKRTILIIAVAFIVLIGGASVIYTLLGDEMAPDQLVTEKAQQQEADEEGVQQDTAAPDFTVYDAEGNEIRLSDYIGKPIVLNFWASWCGPCQHEMPYFDEKYLEMGEEVAFLMVNMTDGYRETTEIAGDFVAENGYSFPVLYDVDSDAGTIYEVYSLPTTFFIDSEGNIAAQATGAIDAETLQRGIDMIK